MQNGAEWRGGRDQITDPIGSFRNHKLHPQFIVEDITAMGGVIGMTAARKRAPRDF